MEGELTWGGELTLQHTDNVLWKCTPDIYICNFISQCDLNKCNKKFLKNELLGVSSHISNIHRPHGFSDAHNGQCSYRWLSLQKAPREDAGIE